MDRKCSNCSSIMIENCDVYGHGLSSVYISKSGKGIFNNENEDVRACLCTNCGNVSFYIENPIKFKRFEE